MYYQLQLSASMAQAPKQTVQEIIDQGQYLMEGHNLEGHTIPQLHGILTHHSVPCGVKRKADIVDLLRPRVMAMLQQEMLAAPSCNGIRDGLTGKPLKTKK